MDISSFNGRGIDRLRCDNKEGTVLVLVHGKHKKIYKLKKSLLVDRIGCPK